MSKLVMVCDAITVLHDGITEPFPKPLARVEFEWNSDGSLRAIRRFLTCPVCGCEFQQKRRGHLFCCRRCKDKHRYRIHGEEIKQRSLAWKKANPDKVRKQWRNFYRNHKNDPVFKLKRQKKDKRWRQNNREKVRQHTKSYRLKHKDDPAFKQRKHEQHQRWYYERGGKEKVAAYNFEWYWLRGNREQALKRMKLRYESHKHRHVGTPVNLAEIEVDGQKRIVGAIQLEKAIAKRCSTPLSQVVRPESGTFRRRDIGSTINYVGFSEAIRSVFREAIHDEEQDEAIAARDYPEWGIVRGEVLSAESFDEVKYNVWLACQVHDNHGEPDEEGALVSYAVAFSETHSLDETVIMVHNRFNLDISERQLILWRRQAGRSRAPLLVKDSGGLWASRRNLSQ